MIYKLKARVAGEIVMTSPISIEREGIIFEAIPNIKGILETIAVSKRVDVSKYTQSITPGEGDVKLHMVIDGDKETHEELIAILQSLESQISIASEGGLYKLFYETPEINYMPETPEEEERIFIRKTNLSSIPPFPSLNPEIDEVKFGKIVDRLGVFNKLNVPLAFWREGVNELRLGRYIQGFISFYYIFEGLYGGGKSSEKQLLLQFGKHEDFMQILEKVFVLVVEDDKHKRSLEPLFNDESCELESSEIAKFLIRVRGKLHHVSLKSSREQATPFNQAKYVSLAIFAQAVARRVLENEARKLKAVYVGQDDSAGKAD